MEAEALVEQHALGPLPQDQNHPALSPAPPPLHWSRLIEQGARGRVLHLPQGATTLVDFAGRTFGVSRASCGGVSILWDVRWPPGVPCPRCHTLHWAWDCTTLLPRPRTSLLPEQLQSSPAFRVQGLPPEDIFERKHEPTGRGEDVLTAGDVEANPGPTHQASQGATFMTEHRGGKLCGPHFSAFFRIFPHFPHFSAFFRIFSQ